MSERDRDRQQTLWELAPVAMVAVDATARVVAWNRAAELLFGYAAAEVIEKPYPLCPPEQAAAFARMVAVALTAEKAERSSAPAPMTAGERLHKAGHRLGVRIAAARAGTATAPLFLETYVDCTKAPAAAAPAPPPPSLPGDPEVYFRAFMDNTPLPAWVSRADDGTLLFVNPAYAGLCGLPTAQTLGKTAYDIYPAEEAAEYRARDELVRCSGQTMEWHTSFRNSQGPPRETMVIKFPIPGTTGQRPASPDPPLFIGAIAIDLTEHQVLREQLYQQAQLISHGPQAVFIVDKNGRICSWNHSAELAFGYTASQALDIDVTELFPPAARAEAARPPALVSLLSSGDGLPTETWLRRHSGEIFCGQVQCKPLLNSDGAQLGTIAYVQDITQHKRIEEELGEQQARTQGIVNTAVDVILTLSENGTIESANPAVYSLLGYQPEELVGGAVSVILPAGAVSPHDEYRRRSKRSGDRHVTGRSRSREINVRTKAGQEIPVQISIGEMQLGERRVYTGIIHDLTDRKSLELQFLQSQKMEAVGILAGGVAHDFNNLLTAINGYSDLLLRSLSPGGSTHSMVQEIHLAGTRGARLTRQLLAFSRKQVLALVVLSLNRVVADMVKLIARLVGEDVVLQTNLCDTLWPCRADLGQIEQVVMNLAVNARDAMASGGLLTLSTHNVTITAEEARSDQPAGDYVCLTVADSGCGMDAATQARMFEPFFTTKEAGRGTGLGLATVYGIIKQSEGCIVVDSAPGRGSAFRIFLPRSKESVSVAPVSPPRRELLPSGEVILLVEDEVSVRTMTHRLLLRGGYVVLAAASAVEAEQLCATHHGPVHLLLTDIVMPGQSGIELSARLRKQRPELAVLYISGYAEGSLPVRSALPPGATLLPKPYTSETLLTRVREVLDRRPKRRRSDPPA